MSVKEKKTNISFGGNKDNRQNMKSAGTLKKNVRMKSNPSSSRDEIKVPPP
jgi:hypothetical protein